MSINNSNVLNEITLGDTVINSSLTKVGTITTGVWNATPIDILNNTDISINTIQMNWQDKVLNINDIYLKNTGDSLNGNLILENINDGLIQINSGNNNNSLVLGKNELGNNGWNINNTNNNLTFQNYLTGKKYLNINGNTGNISIGWENDSETIINNPREKLDVKGNIKVSGTAKINTIDVSNVNILNGTLNISNGNLIAGNISNDHLSTNADIDMTKINWVLGAGLNFGGGVLSSQVTSGSIINMDVADNADMDISKTNLNVFYRAI